MLCVGNILTACPLNRARDTHRACVHRQQSSSPGEWRERTNGRKRGSSGGLPFSIPALTRRGGLFGKIVFLRNGSWIHSNEDISLPGTRMHASRSQMLDPTPFFIFIFFHFLFSFFFLCYYMGCLNVAFTLAVMSTFSSRCLPLTLVPFCCDDSAWFAVYIFFFFISLSRIRKRRRRIAIQSASCFFLASRTYVARFIIVGDA